jgi:hypothetical protein
MSADLNSEIASLQAEFQGVANLHPWVCLAIPREGPVQVGELVWPAAPPPEPPGKILDGYGRPMIFPGPSLEERAAYCKAVGAVRFSDEHGRERDASIAEVDKVLRDLERTPDELFRLYGPPPWVMLPDSMRLRPIVEHVKAMTWRAGRLLFRVLDGPNRIPDEIRQQIQEWEGRCPQYGWIHWLRHAVCITGPHYRIENYPQVAATALDKLATAVLPDCAAQRRPPVAPPAPEVLPPARHGPDFRSVHWYGNDYTFTPTQAACVKVLWEAWKNGTPEVGQETILEHPQVEAESKRLVDVFKDHPAWGTMIVKGQTAGAYKLAAPAGSS